MIINNQVKEVTTNLNNSQKMVINVSSQAIRQRLVNMYSKPHSAIVRELCSNCVDIHIKTNNYNPYIIKKPSALDPVLIFRDFGSGLSPEDIHKYLNSLYSTTKSNTNKEVGGFGLGSKSPFALVSTFTLNSYIDGIKHTCLWFKDEEDIPVLNVLSSTPTKESNGLEYIITLPNEHHDLINFSIDYMTEFFPVKAIICYDYNKIDEGTIPSKYILKETDDYFIIKDRDLLLQKVTGSMYNSNNILISIGGVLYTFNRYMPFTNHFIPSNIIYKMPIGSIDLPDTREQIQHSNHNTNFISSKIKDIATKYSNAVEAELKLLQLSLKDSSPVEQVIAYSDFAIAYGFNSSVVFSYLHKEKIDIIIPEEFRFNGKITWNDLRVSSFKTSLISKNRNNKYSSTSTNINYHITGSQNNSIILIDDLIKIPVSQIPYVDEDLLFDIYYRFYPLNNSDIDVEKLIKFFNTFITPFNGISIMKASEFFTPELKDKYNESKIKNIKISSSKEQSSKSKIKSLPNFRFFTLNGKNKLSDFQYNNLIQFEYNGSKDFNNDYASIIEDGIVIFRCSSPEHDIGSINTLTTYANKFNKQVHFLRSTKPINEELINEVKDSFKDNENVLVLHNNINNSEDIIKYINPDILSNPILQELESLYYIEDCLPWDIKSVIFKNVIKDNHEFYPKANKIFEERRTAWHNERSDRILDDFHVPLYSLLAEIIKEENIDNTSISFLRSLFIKSGHILMKEENYPKLVNTLFKNNKVFLYLRLNKEYTLDKYILEKIGD